MTQHRIVFTQLFRICNKASRFGCARLFKRNVSNQGFLTRSGPATTRNAARQNVIPKFEFRHRVVRVWVAVLPSSDIAQCARQFANRFRVAPFFVLVAEEDVGKTPKGPPTDLLVASSGCPRNARACQIEPCIVPLGTQGFFWTYFKT